jgi:hypothetical protein
LLVAALLAGCGGGGSSSSTTTATTAATSQSTSTPAATAPAATAPAGGTTAPATKGGTSAAPSPQAVAACKRQIRSTRTLTPEVKSKLEAVCVKAAKGDNVAVKKVGREVCEEVINRSPLPPGASKDKALAACRK